MESANHTSPCPPSRPDEQSQDGGHLRPLLRVDSHSHAPHPAGGQEHIRPHGTLLPHSDSRTRITEATAAGSAGLGPRVVQGLSFCVCVLRVLQALLLRGCELVLPAHLQSERGGRRGLSSHPSLCSLRRVKAWVRAAADSPYSALSGAGLCSWHSHEGSW